MGKRWLALIAVLVAALAWSAPAAGAQPGPTPGTEYVTVQFDVGLAGRAQRASGQRPLTLAEEGFRQLQVPPGKTKDQFLAELRALPEVLHVEAPEAGAVRAALVPNDPYYATTVPSQQAYLDQVGAAAAWDIHSGSNEVVVAVLDSGLDLAHEEFAGRLWENPGDADGDGVDDDHNGCIDDRYGCRFINLTEKNKVCGYTETASQETAHGDVRDDHAIPGSDVHSHGTLVTGILGATGNNGKGVSGIAWNVKIMPVKVLDCGLGNPSGGPGGAEFNLAEGIDYAVRMGADIINLSLATDRDVPVIRTALAHAQEAGVIVVTATGNGFPGNLGAWYPAAYLEFPNVIAVGATNNQVSATAWAEYSRYGPAVDFAAPANGLFSTGRSDLGFANPYFNTGGKGGTSFSTPIVAGVFALLMSRNPNLGPADYIQIARDTATPPTPAPHGQNWAGSGIINAGAAIARVPMLVSGEALHDWKYVPPGTQVRALIDGVECGVTTVQSTGVLSFYTVRVKAHGELAGCGAPGKTVQLMVGGSPAQPTFTWGGQNESLAMLQKSVSSVSPPPGAVVVQALNGGWSNIAVLDGSGTLPNVLSSLSGWNAIYRWNPDAAGFTGPGAYERYARGVPGFVNSMATLATYEAIWIDGPAGNVASLTPNPPASRTIALKAGWNNVVYTGTNREVKAALAGIAGKYTAVLQRDNAAQAWRRYTPGVDRYLNDFGGLFKLQVYWIYMKEPANLTMN